MGRWELVIPVIGFRVEKLNIRSSAWLPRGNFFRDSRLDSVFQVLFRSSLAVLGDGVPVSGSVYQVPWTDVAWGRLGVYWVPGWRGVFGFTLTGGVVRPSVPWDCGIRPFLSSFLPAGNAVEASMSCLA